MAKKMAVSELFRPPVEFPDVPYDHLVRAVARVLDTSWVRAELSPHCSHTGRPSIDPVLMIRMLIVGCVNIMLRLVVTCR